MTVAELRDMTFGFRRARAVMAGNALGVFDALAEAPLSVPALAERCGLALRGAEVLLGALLAIGVIERQGDGYANSEAVRRVLAPKGDRSRRHVVTHDLWHQGLWARLEESLRSGQPLRDRDHDPFFTKPEVLAGFFPNLAQAMVETSHCFEAKLVDALHLSGSERLLDLGGGCGNLSLALARRHPGLQVEILDLAPVAREAARAAAQAGLADRVLARSGNFLVDPLDPGAEGYDRVLLSRVLMGLDDEAAHSLLARIREILRPRGSLAVIEFRREGEPRAAAVGALLDLDMLLSSGGRVRGCDELHQLLAAAGFTVRARPLTATVLLLEACPRGGS